jgi:hypothetical protein
LHSLFSVQALPPVLPPSKAASLLAISPAALLSEPDGPPAESLPPVLASPASLPKLVWLVTHLPPTHGKPLQSATVVQVLALQTLNEQVISSGQSLSIAQGMDAEAVPPPADPPEAQPTRPAKLIEAANNARNRLGAEGRVMLVFHWALPVAQRPNRSA